MPHVGSNLTLVFLLFFFSQSNVVIIIKQPMDVREKFGLRVREVISTERQGRQESVGVSLRGRPCVCWVGEGGTSIHLYVYMYICISTYVGLFMYIR